MRILVVEDERLLADQIVRGLREDLHTVDLACDGPSAIDHALASQAATYDAIVLDVMLPGCDGFAVCRRLRDADVRTPIIMLTARRAIEDRIRGLDTGADDYLVKPFAFGELLARLRSLARREPGLHVGPLQAADLSLDPVSHRVERGGQAIHLTAREYAILELLLRHQGQALTRDQLAAGAWDLGAEHLSNVVDVFMRRLRAKIDDGQAAKLIHTVRGVGYMLSAGRRQEDDGKGEAP